MAYTAEQENKEFERRKKVFQEYLHSNEYQDKLKERLKIQDAGKRSPKARGYIWHLCRRPDNPIEGCKFFINNFGWSFDPRPEHEPHHLPFITFEYQDRAIEWIINHIDGSTDGLVEKSRDMGVSWLLFVYVPLWYWLFRDGVNILLGSYKEALVDDRTDDSLFGKIDYAINNLPEWMYPSRFNKNKHRTHMKLQNPETGNLISGDTMNPDFGRGARKTAILFDELGSWDYAKDGWESSGDSTSCRIGNSTPKGYNFFAMLRESGIDVLTLHWEEHPLKDRSWYEYECNRRTEEEVAQELDISYTKSREGRVYPQWNDNNVHRGLYEYDDTLPLFCGWDFGKTDDTSIIWVQPQDGQLRVVDTYRNNGKNIEFYVPIVTGLMPGENDYNYTDKDREIIYEHKNWKRATHFGDPAGRFQNPVTDETVIDVLRRYNINVNFQDSWKSFQKRIRAARLRMRDGVLLNNNERVKYFDTCMINASFPKVRRDGVEEVNSKDQKPKHDWTSHYRSAWEYLCLGLENYTEKRSTPRDKFDDGVMENRRKRKSVGY